MSLDSLLTLKRSGREIYFYWIAQWLTSLWNDSLNGLQKETREGSGAEVFIGKHTMCWIEKNARVTYLPNKKKKGSVLTTSFKTKRLSGWRWRATIGVIILESPTVPWWVNVSKWPYVQGKKRKRGEREFGRDMEREKHDQVIACTPL